VPFGASFYLGYCPGKVTTMMTKASLPGQKKIQNHLNYSHGFEIYE